MGAQARMIEAPIVKPVDAKASKSVLLDLYENGDVFSWRYITPIERL
jgi:hypothetical protein